MMSFVYKSKLFKNCIFILQLVFFLPVLGAEKAPSQEANNPKQEIVAEIKDQENQSTAESPDKEDLFGQFMLSTEDDQQQSLAKKEAYFKELPQTFQDAYNFANQKYTNFLESIDIKNGLRKLGNKIKESLNKLADKKKIPENIEIISQIKNLIDKFDAAVFAGAFKQIPAMPKKLQRAAFSSLQERVKEIQQAKSISDPSKSTNDLKKEFDDLANFQLDPDEKSEDLSTKCTFDEKDFDELFESFAKMLPYIKDPEDTKHIAEEYEELIHCVINFRNIVIAIKNNDQPEMVKRYLKYISPLQKEAIQALKVLRKIFSQELIPLRQSSNAAFDAGDTDRPKDPKEVLYSYWLNETKESLENMRTFENLTITSNSVFGQTEWLLETVGFIYDLAKPIAKFHLSTMPASDRCRWWSQTALEYGVNLAFACWYKKIEDFYKSKSSLNSHILNGVPLVSQNNTNPIQMLLSMGQTGNRGGIEAFQNLIQNIFKNMTRSQDPMEKVIGKGGILFLNFATALQYGFQSKGLSAKLLSALGNYPRIAMISLELKNIASVALFEHAVDYCKTHEFKRNLPYWTRRKLLGVGLGSIDYGFSWARQEIDKLMPSFWTNISTMSLGIVNPEILKLLSEQSLQIFAHSSGFMDKTRDKTAEDKDIIDRLNNTQTSFDSEKTLNNYRNFTQAQKSFVEHFGYKGLFELANSKEFTYAHKFAARLCSNITAENEAYVRYNKFKEEDKHKLPSLQVYLIESFLVSHIFSCIGAKLGKIAVEQFKKPLFGATFKIFDCSVDKLLSLCNNLNLIDEAERDDYYNTKMEFEAMFDNLPQLIHKFFSICSGTENSTIEDLFGDSDDRMLVMFIGLFMQQILSYAGITAHDEPEAAKRKILIHASNLLISHTGLIGYNDAHEMLKVFDEKANLVKIIHSEMEPKISPEFIKEFHIKLENFNAQLAKEFDTLCNEQGVTTKMALMGVSANLEQLKETNNSDHSKKDELLKMISLMLNHEISEGFITDFSCKLAKFDIALAKEFTNMIANKETTPKDALLKVSKQLETRFAKLVAEKIKVGIFANAVGKFVITPLLNQTVGNWLRNKGTVLDGVNWMKNKATSAASWIANRGRPSIE